MKSIRTIFFLLIGTVVVSFALSATIELFNINTTGIQMRSTVKMAARQSAILFSQETYKTADGKGSANLATINYRDESGNLLPYVTGNFYPSENAEEIWFSLYTNDRFKNWVDTIGVQGNWDSINILEMALNNNVFNGEAPSWDSSQDEIDNYNKIALARSYLVNLYTPLNMGIPYLDLQTVNRMFRWNLTQLLSDCDINNIKLDDAGAPYVYYKGFRCYADSASITNLDYRVYDLNIEADRQNFRAVTNINPNNLNFINTSSTLGSIADERTRVCVVGISYNLPMAYEGITPIKDLCSFFWNYEVSGYNKEHTVSPSGRTWNDSVQSFSDGGLFGNSTAPGVLPTTGKLVYVLVK